MGGESFVANQGFADCIKGDSLETHLQWRTKGESATLSRVVLRTCTVAVKDVRDVEHSIEVTAETLYEANRHRSCGLAAGQLGRRDRTGIYNGDCSGATAARET